MELSLAQIQAAIGAQIANACLARTPWSAQRVRGWSIDSRTVKAGDLFFAIRGEQFDGHAFAGAALDAGAIAAVVSEPVDTASGLILRVSDTVQALQSIAKCGRQQWARPVVAITGSAGKTSTKDIVAHLLSVRFRVAKTEGNLNNHLGLPLTLLRIPDDAELAVVEIGMNHAGEIRRLAAIALPQIGLVTNVGYAHVEAFDSIEAIAAAKRELIEALPETGAGVLNADDRRVLAFRDVHRGRVLTYGFSPEADIRATAIETSADGARFTVSGVRFETRLTGQHSVHNVLAGLAVASLFQIDFRELVASVAELAPGRMRGERSQWNGITILNDSYNSNSEAARRMIDVLREQPANRRIAVLGEMLELGRLAETLHRDLGTYVANAGIDVLIGVRGVSRLMVDEAIKAGLSDHAAFFFEDPEAAGAFLRVFVRPGDAILFKGSRGIHIERALARMEE
jgi:UDP-N-acetylmuramoyl-tripeptide--D-alanyl-D-alanine ligase